MINSFFSSRLFFGMVFIIAFLSLFLGLFGYFKQENAKLRSQINKLESDKLFNSSSEVDEYDFRRLKRKVSDLEDEVEKLKRKVSDLEYKVR